MTDFSFATMRKGLWLLLLPALLAYVAMVALAEYTKTGSCYRNGSTLSAEELRAQTIRSLLTAEMESSARENKYQIFVQTFLIRRSLTSNDVIDAVVSKSIVNLPKDAAYPLNSDQDVASVDPKFLRGEFSIVRYGAGNVRIIPSTSLEAVDADVARAHFDGEQKHGLGLSLLERALGYGNYYFRVEGFRFINLGCCKDFYSEFPKNGITREEYARRIIDSIVTGKQPIRNYLVVSNCGDVLRREYDDEPRHLF
jgi:hypothetical protein